MGIFDKNLTVQDIEAKFMRAHQAGDKVAAKALADEVKRLRALPQVDAAPSFGEGLSSALRVAGDTASFGGTDWLRSKLYGTTQEEERKTTEADAARLGPVGEVATRTGAAMAGPQVMAAAPAKLARPLRTVGHAVEGGVQSALDAYGHGQSWSDIGKAGVTGAGLTGVVSAIADPISSWLSRRQQRAKAIENQTYGNEAELGKAKSAEYGKVDKSGVVYSAGNLKNLGAELNRLDLVPGRDDKAIALIKERMKQWKGKDMSPSELDAMRQDFRNSLKATDIEKKQGRDIVEAIDKFTAGTPPVKPLPGGVQGPRAPVPQINDTLENARALAAREFQHKTVRRTAEKAERNVTSGRMNPFAPSPESATVKEFSKLDEKIKTGKSPTKFPPAVEAGIEQLYKGTPFRNFAGQAEKLSFSGKELPRWAKIAAFPVTGAAEVIQRLGKGATQREIEDLQALIRDPSGVGLKVSSDPEYIAKIKDKLARMMTAGYRAQNRQDGGPR